MKMTIRLLGLICLVFTQVCFFNGANLSADDSWKNFYGISGKASQPDEAIKYAKQIGYDYLALASGSGNKAIYAANPDRAGLKFYLTAPERLLDQVPTITKLEIDTTMTYTQAQIDFFNNYMTWKSTDTVFPNNIATGWYFSSTRFGVRWDLQQQAVINYLVEQFITMARSYENTSLPFTFAGYMIDVPRLSGDFNIYDAARPNLNTSEALSYWTGSDSGLVHGTITHEYSTYTEAKAAFFKRLNTRMRQEWPNAKWILEPWNLYDAKVAQFPYVDEWIYQIKDRANKDEMTPDLLLSEKASTDFVDNSNNFNSGVNITRDMVGISHRSNVDEDANRLYAAKAGINGAWYNWFIGFSGETGTMPAFTSVIEVYPRLKLIRLIPNWDNLNNIPLANRSWNSSTTDPIYNSYDNNNNQQSYVDGNVMYSRHPKTGNLFAVFLTTNGVINLKVGETVDSMQRTDGYFVESGDASADFDITGNKIRLKSSISIDVDSSNNQVKGNGYIFTLSSDGSPKVKTGSATNLTSNSAVLNGTVNAGGLSTTATSFVKSEESSSGQFLYTWEPVNINGGGFTNFIIIDPQETKVVYAGVDVGGIYKSIDCGEHWRPCNKGLNWPTDRLAAALTIDPKSKTMYLGVGGWGKGGIFKSTDNGKSWQLLTREVKFNFIGISRPKGKGLIVIDPSDSNIIYAGSYKDGIFKSLDGGKTWTKKGLVYKCISSILIDPANPQIIYVSTVCGKENGKDFQGGIFKSKDGGNSWQDISDEANDVHQLVMVTKKPNIIYAACGGQGIFKTTDGGNTWVEKNKGLEELVLSKLKLSDLKYVSLVVDPENPEIIYAGSGERRGQLYKSVDGGKSWAKLTGNKKNIHPDGWWIKETNWPGDVGYFANCLAIDPNNSNRIYVSGRSGIWRSGDGGITWHAKVKGLEATCLSQIAFDPKRLGAFFVGNIDWVFFRSIDSGKTFDRSLKGIGNWDCKEDKDKWEKYKMKNGLCFAVDPRQESSIVYFGGGATGSNSGTIFKSTDGGENWHEANSCLPIAEVTALAIDQSNYNILFAALKEKGLYKTTDGGINWEKVNMGKFNYGNFSQGRPGNLILIHPKFNNIIYILDKGIGVYKTINSGKDWEDISKNLPQEGIKGMDQFVGGMALDHNNPDIAYLGLRKHGVYKTVNGGKKWKKITPDYMQHGGAISIDPADGAIYLASVPGVGDEDIKGFTPGIYKSIDGGKSWFPIHTGDLLNISLKVTSLAIDPHSKGNIYLTTQGNGIIIGEPNK